MNYFIVSMVAEKITAEASFIRSAIITNNAIFFVMICHGFQIPYFNRTLFSTISK